MRSEISIADPKLRARDGARTNNWFKYYPGFSEKFARLALASAGLGRGAWVLDPWNGSGTTTAAALALGLNAYGFDMNPVMVLAARARCLDRAEFPSLRPIAAALLRRRVSARFTDQDDPLSAWLSPRSVGAVRGVEAAVQGLLVDAREYAPLKGRDIDGVSGLAAFFYVALFRTLRRILGPFLTSNPMWVKRPASPRERLRPSAEAIVTRFRAELCAMLQEVAPLARDARVGAKVISVGSSECLPLGASTVDLAVGSPPYCTRIDYGVATSIELALLGYGLQGEFRELRRKLIGSAMVPKESPRADPAWGRTCTALLSAIKEHSSKASATYYYKNHAQYFRSIFRSIAEISRVLKPGARCVLVVQDSFYKDVHNDLPRVCTEMAAEQGLDLLQKQDFALAQTLARINPGTNGYRSSFAAVESVLVLGKRCCATRTYATRPRSSRQASL